MTFSDCRMSGALLPRAQMLDVTFSEVRLDGVNFRMIEGERVMFDHANLERGELIPAHLKSGILFRLRPEQSRCVSGQGCRGLAFTGLTSQEIKGSEYLRDVVIDSPQVLPLAKGVFAGLNNSSCGRSGN